VNKTPQDQRLAVNNQNSVNVVESWTIDDAGMLTGQSIDQVMDLREGATEISFKHVKQKFSGQANLD
jgi:hypothetical protein